ncbi:hypothetical protein PR048_028924 [Dryococelus australis]|uniref:Uncharacterized protein n=1 Tax=Dryococelus australis TaxID=614101 RepID=A0ABQ9GBX7_9NEOP|nr:hypothetical protein PR048_028924 [Dryococelus australis]
MLLHIWQYDTRCLFPCTSVIGSESSRASRGGAEVRILSSHLGEPGSILGGVTRGLSRVRIDAAGRRIFSAISGLLRPLHSGAVPYSPNFTLIGSQDPDVKSRTNLSTPYKQENSQPNFLWKYYPRLDCSPPTKVNRVQSPAVSLRISASEIRAGRCRWFGGGGGGSRGSPTASFRRCSVFTSLHPPYTVSSFPGRVTGFSQVGIVADDAAGRRVFSGFSRSPPPHVSFRRRSIFTCTTLIGSQDVAVKSRPNLFTHYLELRRKRLPQHSKKHDIFNFLSLAVTVTLSSFSSTLETSHQGSQSSSKCNLLLAMQSSPLEQYAGADNSASVLLVRKTRMVSDSPFHFSALSGFNEHLHHHWTTGTTNDAHTHFTSYASGNSSEGRSSFPLDHNMISFKSPLVARSVVVYAVEQHRNAKAGKAGYPRENSQNSSGNQESQPFSQRFYCIHRINPFSWAIHNSLSVPVTLILDSDSDSILKRHTISTPIYGETAVNITITGNSDSGDRRFLGTGGIRGRPSVIDDVVERIQDRVHTSSHPNRTRIAVLSAATSVVRGDKRGLGKGWHVCSSCFSPPTPPPTLKPSLSQRLIKWKNDPLLQNHADWGNHLSQKLPIRLGNDLSQKLPIRLGNDLSQKLPIRLGNDLSQKLPIRLGNDLSQKLPIRLGNDLSQKLPIRLGNDLSQKLPIRLGNDLSQKLPIRLGNDLSQKLAIRLGNDLSQKLPIRLGNYLSQKLPIRLGNYLSQKLHKQNISLKYFCSPFYRIM